MNEQKLTDTIRMLALRAGDAIMEIYGRADLAVHQKADASPVTEADEAADALISEGLRATFPDIALVTEEQAASHGQSAAEFLIVDPLDGTKEFIRRRGDFTVNIALVRDGIPVHGVVYAPARRRLFRTLPGGGAVEEAAPFGPVPDPAAVRVLRVRAPQDDGLVVVASKSHRTPETDAYIARYEVRDSRSAGSSLKFCLLASGEADLYPRLGPTMEWDTAAGDAVLRAAGGTVLRLDDLSLLTYGKPGYRNPFFLAHVPGVIPQPL